MAGAVEDLLQAFNALDEGETFRSVATLAVGVPHPLLKITRINTKHGEKLKARVSLPQGAGEATVILPSRFTALTDDKLEGMNACADAGHPFNVAFMGRAGDAFKVQLSQ